MVIVVKKPVESKYPVGDKPMDNNYLKTIVFACGGTLGHINPALAMAEHLKLKERYRIIFFSSLKEKYNKTYDSFNYQIYYFNCFGFNRKRIFKNLKNYFNNLRVKKEIAKIYKKEDVSLVIGMGGSIGTLAVLAAKKNNIKTMIHEQNAIIGLGNKIVAKKVDKVLLTYPLDNIKNGIVVGNPLRFANKQQQNKENIILIFGGSLGADAINDFFIDNYKLLQWNNNKVVIIVGDKYYQKNICKIKNNESINLRIIDRTEEMDNYYQKAFIVICRGGATTISEVIDYQKCAIVIPSPNVSNNHQYYNALFYHQRNCLELLNEEDLNITNINLLLNKLSDYGYRRKISENISKYKINNAKELFELEIIELIGE